MVDSDEQLQANTYIWSQSDDQVTLSFLVPESCHSKDLDIIIKPQYVKVGIKGQEPVIKGKLFAPINHFDSLWQLEKNPLSSFSSLTASPSLSIASSYAFMSSANHSPISSMILPAPALAESISLDPSSTQLDDLLQQTEALGSSSPSPDVSQPASPVLATPPTIETPPMQRGHTASQSTKKYCILTIHLEKEEEGLTWAIPISGSEKEGPIDVDPTSAFHIGLWLEERMKYNKKALDYYLSAAKRNYTRAMIKVAALYEIEDPTASTTSSSPSSPSLDKNTVPRDAVQAFAWYQQAADMPEQAASTNSSSGPDPLACYIVGTQYGSGSPEANVEKNYVEALKYFNRCMAITSSRINIDFSALDGTIPKSMLRPHPPHGQDERHFCGSAFQAGLMYLYGSSPEGERVHSVTSVEADPALAIRYWKEAGVLGHAQACYNLGIVYANGMGVEADRVEAGKWFGRAGKLDSTGKLVAPNGIQVLEWDASVNAVPGVQPKKRVHRKRRSRKTKDQGGLPVLWMIGSALAVSGVAWWYYTRHSK